MELIDQLRDASYFTAIYADVPAMLAAESLSLFGKRQDLFSNQRVLASDDVRLAGHVKICARGWHALSGLASTQKELLGMHLVAIENGSHGVVGALTANYGAVVVVPDPETRSVDEWDEDSAVERYLKLHPSHASKLYFLRSLSDIKID